MWPTFNAAFLLVVPGSRFFDLCASEGPEFDFCQVADALVVADYYSNVGFAPAFTRYAPVVQGAQRP
jgi:hypothetical protein